MIDTTECKCPTGNNSIYLSHYKIAQLLSECDIGQRGWFVAGGGVFVTRGVSGE